MHVRAALATKNFSACALDLAGNSRNSSWNNGENRLNQFLFERRGTAHVTHYVESMDKESNWQSATATEEMQAEPNANVRATWRADCALGDRLFFSDRWSVVGFRRSIGQHDRCEPRYGRANFRQWWSCFRIGRHADGREYPAHSSVWAGWQRSYHAR